MSLLLNKKAIKSFVTAKQEDLRVSSEFYTALDIIIRERIIKAIGRNKSLSLKTLKKDQLYM
jgi:hypothetical protein